MEDLTGETLEPIPNPTQWVSEGLRPVRFPVGMRVGGSDQGKSLPGSPAHIRLPGQSQLLS